MRFKLLLLIVFLVSCADPSDTESKLKASDKWPQLLVGEVVIADHVADDNGIIWATGWVEVTGTEDKVGIQFEGEVLKTIDLNHDPIGTYSVWVGPPKNIEFEVQKIEKFSK
ncbi:MAG: hypothetical protein ACRBB6_00235 [Neptuniibacter sp.]